MMYRRIPVIQARLEILQVEDNSYTVLDPSNGSVHYTDDIGIEIIHLIDGKRTIDDITNALSIKYDAPSIEIFRDVEEYMKHLTSIKMVAIT